MHSMTGYGRGSAMRDGREITVEVKSVNHRFLDVSTRLPRHIAFLEEPLRRFLSERLAWGHVDVFVNYRNTRSDARTVRIDTALLGAYLAAARQAAAELSLPDDIGLCAALRLPDDIGLCAALRLPDVTEIAEAEEDREAVCALCLEAAEIAVGELLEMRRLEGERLGADLAGRIDAVLALTERIAVRAPLVVEEYRQKLNDRIEQILQTGEIDRARLATEVALFADRASIDEEIVRLRSHVAQARLLMAGDEPAGRKLDFVVQEMNREFNTIGSKANDGTLTGCVLAGKNEIEKIREQVQNIE